MTIKKKRTLTLRLTHDLRSLLPEEAQSLKGPQFNDAISGLFRDLLDRLDGLVKSMSVDGDIVRVEWEQSQIDEALLDPIIDFLKSGRYPEAIFLMELLLSDEPDQIDYLYNLGMAYSDIGKLPRAIDLLTRLVKLAPKHINGRVALGVALFRNNQVVKAIDELKVAVKQDPSNPWAQRNLGAALGKQGRFEESLPYFQRAAELNSEDQAAWYGLGQSLEQTGKVDDADAAYRKALEIDEFSQIAELIRTARSQIAQKTFRSVTPKMERMDAVMYCLGALEKFENFSLAEVQKIGFEIAILGTKGININDPESRYTLRSLPGSYSGLHLLCLEYVAFKKFAPEQDIGFDLSAEYRSALSLFEKKKRK